MAARRNPKMEIMDQFYEVYRNEYRPLIERLFALVDANKVKSGALLVHGRNNHVDWFLEVGIYGSSKYRKTPLWEFHLWLGEFKKDVEALRAYVVENENKGGVENV